MTKIYEGIAVTGKVYVEPKDGQRYELEHHVQHSPTGFSWGYCGSGCAELARCILWDYLGREPEPVLYQKFKVDYISHFRIDQNWIFGSESIQMWLEDEDLITEVPINFSKGVSK